MNDWHFLFVEKVDNKARNQRLTRNILRSYARQVSTIDSDKSLYQDVIANYNEVTDRTIIDYIRVLERLHIIEEIEAWNPNIRSKTAIRTAKKKSMVDPSLAVASLGASPKDIMLDVNSFGLLFENLVDRDLSVYVNSIGGYAQHYRDRYGLECDCILHLNDGRYGLIETKLDVVPNQEFLKFISIKGDKKNFQNLELILNLERNYPGMFIKVMSNFDEAKSYRETLYDSGRPIKVSWEEALKNFYLSNKYVGVTKENEDIAELFGGKGLSQEVFEVANKLRQKAKGTNVPEHILGQPIREETILESIERIKRQTEEELASGREMIEELYDKQFTYEWLSKNDPHNAIMGLFCSCCGTITSQFYGKDI